MNETKENILKTSLFLFLQKSYKEVTMKEIVDRTGLSKGAFYHYFSSKEELFKEIANRFFSMGVVDFTTFNTDSLNSFYTGYVDYLNNNMMRMNAEFLEEQNGKASLNFFLIMFEAVNRFPEFLTTELEMHKKELENWKVIISNARDKGEIKSDSTDEEIANLFLYCNDGAFIRFINNDNKTTYKAYLLSAYNTIYNNLKS